MNSQSPRILYVEDEPDIRSIVQMALEMVGDFTVIACASGDEALRQAPTAGAGLLLLDVMMPGMDGLATLRALRAIAQTAETPAVFMTAKAQASELASYRCAGAVEVIAKPFDPMALASQLRRIWAAHQGA